MPSIRIKVAVLGALAALVAVSACKSNKHAGNETGGSAAKTEPGSSAPVGSAAGVAGSAAPAGGSATPAPSADRCALVGTLEVHRITPSSGCGESGRYPTVTLPIIEASAKDDVIHLEIDPEAAVDLGNTMSTAESKPVATAGTCEVKLMISDAGRADDDESFTYTLQVPLAGGPVKGTLEHSGVDARGKECKTQSAVEGTFTKSAAASR